MSSFANNREKTTAFTRPVWQGDAKPQNNTTTASDVLITSIYPQSGALLAICAVALTSIVLAYSGLFGAIGILVFYALWLPRSIYKGQLVIKPSQKLKLQMGFIGLTIMSAVWSDYRSVTVRASLELLSLFICVMIITRIIPIRAFIRGLIVGIAITLIICVGSNKYGIDSMSGTYSLIGLFGSKNQVGLMSEIGILTTVVFFFTEKRMLSKCLYAVPTGLLCLACLYMSRSMSSVASLIFIFAVLIAAYLYPRMRGGMRVLALTLAAPLTLLAIGMVVAVKGTGLFKLFGKDSTLTGRTFLWAEGIKAGFNDPLFGHGFGAFWVPGQPDAERYWYMFGIFNRTGFHFHNLYIQTFVDLGAVGLIVMLAMIFSNMAKSFKMAITYKTSQSAFFLLAMSAMFLVRAFVEVDFLGPFNIGVMLFFSTAMYLSMQQTPPAASTAASTANL